MSFYEHVIGATETERAELVNVPIIGRALRGDVTLGMYLAFLEQAYHHVKHTVPLLMAAGSRMPDHLEFLREATVHYIEEEHRHEKWILDDIAKAGGDPRAVRCGTPGIATEMMVAYAYYSIERVHPATFFGMALVLEGTSVALAESAADAIRKALQLPRSALRYLYSHGAVDQDHIGFLRGLIDDIQHPEDRRAVVHAARRFYSLYANIFRNLPQEEVTR